MDCAFMDMHHPNVWRFPFGRFDFGAKLFGARFLGQVFGSIEGPSQNALVALKFFMPLL